MNTPGSSAAGTRRGNPAGRAVWGWLVAALLLLCTAGARAQTTQEDLPADSSKPYGPGFPYLPESDPMVELPDLERPPPTILTDPDSYFEWEARGGSPSKTPADFDPAERMALPPTTPVLALPETPVANEAEMQIRDQDQPAFEDIAKTSHTLGMEQELGLRRRPFVPEPRIVFEKEKARRYRIGAVRTALELSQTAAYDSNPFGLSRNAVGDGFTTFQPRLYLETGTRGFASLLYAPNFTRYATYTQFDSQDENLSLSIRYPFSKLELAGDFLYLTQSGLFVASREPTDARSLLGRVFGTYPLGRKTRLFFQYEGRDDKADPGGIATDHSLLLSLDHRQSRDLGYGGSLRVGTVEADFGGQTYATWQLLGSFRPSYHFKLEGQGGFHVRRFSREVAGKSGILEPVFDVTGSYHWNDNTAFVVRGYRSVATVTFESAHLDIETGAESYALVRFFGNTDLKAGIKGGYVEQLAATFPENGDFCFLEGGLSVSWSVSKMWELLLFDHIQRRFGDSAGKGYLGNITGVGCTFRF